MNRNRGFTLVELLVVVGIIALLISILLPSLARAREQARMTKCLSNQREMGKGGATFANDHRSRLQLVASHGVDNSSTSPIDRADPTRRTYEYYDYPTSVYGNQALASIKNKELLVWPVAYGETAGYGFGKKNWYWGVRAEAYNTGGGSSDAVTRKDAIESQSYELAVCPSDDVKIGSPGWPDPDQIMTATGFNNALQGTDDANHEEYGNSEQAITGSRYYGALSFAINEDIVGSDQAYSGEVKPGCFQGGGKANGTEDCRGGLDDCAGPRLRGDLDKVFQASKTLLFVDAGMDKGPREDSVQRVMLVNSDSFIMEENGIDGGLTSDDRIRATLGTFTWVHQDANIGNSNNRRQVLPSMRHSDGKLNVVYADFHGNAIAPVRFRCSTSGPLVKVPVLWADGLSSVVWVTPYDVKANFDYGEDVATSAWPLPTCTQ